jgi:GntR family transcriptional regulator, histidine utilization repressor
VTISLHDRITSDIESRILNGELAPGDRIPTEAELMLRFDCARMTVNKALSNLTTSGLLERRKRAGTFVASPKLHSMILDVPDLQQEVLRRGQSYDYRLLKSRRRRPARRNDAEAMLAGSGDLLDLEGIHLANGKPLATESRLISLAAVPSILDANLQTVAPGTWLLQNVPWTEVATRISALAADDETASLLDVGFKTACLSIERRTWRGAEQITSVRQTFRGDAYDLIARFSSTNPRTMREFAT